jgi:S-disulfanyl-L-cysteine oxidoreductase SoxD
MADLHLLGLFNNVDPAAEAIDRLHKLGVSDEQINVMSGAPYSAEVLGRPHMQSRVGCAATMGAITGVGAATFLTIGLFLLYPIIQGGQPLVPVPPSLIVFFEVTMLGTMWASFFGLLVLSKFPVTKDVPYDPRITSGYIGVEVLADEKKANDIEKLFNDSGAVSVKRTPLPAAIDRNFRLFWATVGGALTVAVVVLGLFVYQVIPLNFPSNMVDQDSFGYEQGPRLAAPADAVPIQGPALIAGQPASLPVPSSATSVARGKTLFNIYCMLCHGETGEGNGNLRTFFNPQPANLTSATIQKLEDAQIFLVITNGFGPMPPLYEHLSPTERWDVINYVRTLKK